MPKYSLVSRRVASHFPVKRSPAMFSRSYSLALALLFYEENVGICPSHLQANTWFSTVVLAAYHNTAACIGIQCRVTRAKIITLLKKIQQCLHHN